MPEFDLQALLAALHQRDVRFVVIGGVAVAAHGYVRGTEDLDLVPDPDPENLKRLVAALEELESKLPTAGGRSFDPTGDAGVVRRGGNVTADTCSAGSTLCSGHGASRAIRSLSRMRCRASCWGLRYWSARFLGCVR